MDLVYKIVTIHLTKQCHQRHSGFTLMYMHSWNFGETSIKFSVPLPLKVVSKNFSVCLSFFTSNMSEFIIAGLSFLC